MSARLRSNRSRSTGGDYRIHFHLNLTLCAYSILLCFQFSSSSSSSSLWSCCCAVRSTNHLFVSFYFACRCYCHSNSVRLNGQQMIYYLIIHQIKQNKTKQEKHKMLSKWKKKCIYIVKEYEISNKNDKIKLLSKTGSTCFNPNVLIANCFFFVCTYARAYKTVIKLAVCNMG